MIFDIFSVVVDDGAVFDLGFAEVEELLFKSPSAVIRNQEEFNTGCTQKEENNQEPELQTENNEKIMNE